MSVKNNTNKAPDIKVSDFKRTKIVATIGPVTDSYEMIYKMIVAGVNAFRLNFSHGTHEEKARQVKWIRKASHEYGKPVAIIQDLQGPKIRLGDFDGVIPVQTGQEIRLGYETDYERSGVIPVQYDLSTKVKRGERMYIYDGRVRTTITSIQKGIVFARVENDGILIKRKGINLPETDFSGDVFTDKDIKDITFGVNLDCDYVAISFIQSEDDVETMRRHLHRLNYDAKIIVKLETKSAVERIEQIIQTTDILMIARGDLAYEIGPEAVPLVQRQSIELARKYAKQTIVATQMLISMVDQPEPSRAEVSDVSTAVLLGADAVMLSDETTIGKFPIEAISAMKRIAKYNENHQPISLQLESDTDSNQSAICQVVVQLASQINAAAIVAETKSGATAYQIARHRPRQPIIAVTSNPKIAQQLSLVRGVKSFIRRDEKYQASNLTKWLRANDVLQSGDMIVSASGMHPGVVGTTDTIKVRVLE